MGHYTVRLLQPANGEKRITKGKARVSALQAVALALLFIANICRQ